MNPPEALVEIRLSGGLDAWREGRPLEVTPVPGPAEEDLSHHARVEFPAMGCTIRAELASTEPDALSMLARVAEWFEAWEARLTRFRPESELSHLNTSAGTPVGVSPVTWEVIQASLHAARSSQGLVTPLILPALLAAGYDRPFDEMRGEDRPRPLNPPAVPDWRTIELDPSARTVRLPIGTRLDLGGIAKGWAAERAAARLARYGPVLVSAGGDIALRGIRRGTAPWRIAVADPHAPERDLTTLGLRSAGVATSGTDYRRWKSGGAPMHHLIDPRTGAPSNSDVVSATIVAPSLELAEAAAKVAILLGSQEGLAWIERRPELAGLLVLANGVRLESRRLDTLLWRDRA
jgi:thiamine biosynthesis lipoprotein